MIPFDPALPHTWSRARASLAGAALVAVVVPLLAALLYQGQTLVRGSDAADILLSYFLDASRAIAADGPWAAMYVPGVQAGLDQWSNPNYHPLYPLYFNWLGADAGVSDTLRRMNHVAWLHLAILGAGGFQLARSLGVRMLPALAVGLVLPWLPAVRSAAGWPQILAGLAWLPWVLAFQVTLYRRQSRRDVVAGVVGLALAATLLVYAQPAQNLAFAIVASAVAWLAIAAQALLARDRVAMHRHLVAGGWLALAALLVALACGAYLFEVLRFHAGSIRWLGEYGGSLRGGERVPLGALRLHALPWSEAWRLFAFEPRRGIGHAFVGAAVLAAALVVLLRRGGDPVARAVALCGVFALLGCFAFMAPVLHAIPVANKIRELVWWSCLAVACLLPIAATGLQALVDARPAGAVRAAADRWTVLFALALLAGLGALAAVPGLAALPRVEAGLALLAGFAAIAFARHARAAPALARDLAIAAALASVAWVPLRQMPPVPWSEATVFRPDRIEARRNARLLAQRVPDEDDYRIALDPALADSNILVHSYLGAGLRAIRGGISPANAGKFDLLHYPPPALSSLYGVKYTLLAAARAGPGDQALAPGWMLRTDARALPRLFFVPGAPRRVDDVKASLGALQPGDPVPALVAGQELPADAAALRTASCTTQVVRPAMHDNRRLRLHATLAAPCAGVLVLNEDPSGRWRARIDGRPATAFRVNGFQTGFAIPRAGTHEIHVERPGRLGSLRHWAAPPARAPRFDLAR